ncbi:Gti1/Pac2 family-domain-containing protein [Obelidium mucronatum]|nr:Gti1/Pac2 family-domain-containing protein [Obelidium mucronatum]
MSYYPPNNDPMQQYGQQPQSFHQQQSHHQAQQLAEQQFRHHSSSYQSHHTYQPHQPQHIHQTEPNHHHMTIPLSNNEVLRPTSQIRAGNSTAAFTSNQPVSFSPPPPRGASYFPDVVTTVVAQNSSSPPRNVKFHETYYGFVKSKHDAMLLVEACIAGELQPLNVTPVDLTELRIQSGTVIVFGECTSHMQMIRWRDGGKWSPSRINDRFLLYREVCATTTNDLIHPVGNEVSRFTNVNTRPSTRLVPHGFAKRTISVFGHLYAAGRGVRQHHNHDGKLQVPSQSPQFHKFVKLVKKLDAESSENVSKESGVGTSEELQQQHQQQQQLSPQQQPEDLHPQPNQYDQWNTQSRIEEGGTMHVSHQTEMVGEGGVLMKGCFCGEQLPSNQLGYNPRWDSHPPALAPLKNQRH